MKSVEAHTHTRASTLLQLARYGLIGAFVTALGASIYWVSVEWFGIEPLIANSMAFVVGVIIGYALHSGVSFRDHGQRDDLRRTSTRFMLVNLGGYGLNSLWVGLLVNWAGGPTWWPIVPMIIATPVLTFALHRRWTFH